MTEYKGLNTAFLYFMHESYQRKRKPLGMESVRNILQRHDLNVLFPDKLANGLITTPIPRLNHRQYGHTLHMRIYRRIEPACDIYPMPIHGELPGYVVGVITYTINQGRKVVGDEKDGHCKVLIVIPYY